MPKISIILPTYNGERWLAESIQSVIDQTEQDWELIIVNDCSTDDTLKIAKSFIKKDSRISIINNKINKKLPASLNIGFEKARGKYFTWTSDDNLYKPNALEKMAKHLDNNPKTDMVSMNMDIVDEQGMFLSDFDDTYKYQRNPAELIYFCNVGAAFMYRKSIADKVGKYDLNTFCAEDYDYWCRIALYGKLDYISENVYQYRKNEQSLSSTKKEIIRKKTFDIRKKYLNAFLKKYNYTKRDIALFWYNLTKHNRLKEYNLYYLYFNLSKYLTKILLLPLFWHSNLRRKLRKVILQKKYSFSKLKGK